MVTGGKLKRHILRNHGKEKEVQEAKENDSKDILNEFIEKKRQEGMYLYNLQYMTKPLLEKEDELKLMRERKPKTDDKLKLCSACKRFLSNNAFYKHKKVCKGTMPEAIKPMLMGSEDIHKDKDFVVLILNRFRDGEAGTLCREDSLIQQVGYRHFCLRRSETSKIDEIRKSVMAEMRQLARLFLNFQSLSKKDVITEDMFSRDHLPILVEAIEKMVASEEGAEKHGLKLQLNAIILRSIKSLKGHLNSTKQDDKSDELERFKTAYLFRSPEVFAGARYQCTQNSRNKARRPEQLPLLTELKKLKSFTINEINKSVDHFDISQYSWLRSLLICRLTLYNGRRGEEGSRMLLSQWRDAIDNVWLPKDRVEEIEDKAKRFLIDQYRLAYLHGKGKKFVPVLIPEDVIKAGQLLVKYRAVFGIRENNPFMFASKSSASHASGWHAVHKVCEKAEVMVNATRNRHYLSTLYASLDMSPGDQRVFLDHMGHEEAINKENYQCPLGFKVVSVMGPMLRTVDKGKV